MDTDLVTEEVQIAFLNSPLHNQRGTGRHNQEDQIRSVSQTQLNITQYLRAAKVNLTKTF